MAMDLGLELMGVTTLHHDQQTDSDVEGLNTLNHLINTKGDIENYSVCNKQPYQVMKIVQRVKPDLIVVRHMNMTILGTKLGIPSVLEGDVNISAGYDGLIKLGRRLHEALLRKNILKTIAAHVELPYTDWWLQEENPFYFDGGNTL
jgi:nitrogenase molybdenum-iron protein alpha chain